MQDLSACIYHERKLEDAYGCPPGEAFLSGSPDRSGRSHGQPHGCSPRYEWIPTGIAANSTMPNLSEKVLLYFGRKKINFSHFSANFKDPTLHISIASFSRFITGSQLQNHISEHTQALTGRHLPPPSPSTPKLIQQARPGSDLIPLLDFSLQLV